ncbi:MAG TPA: aldehyde dehydrogenase family protein, partial [Acidimicrobiales bacterium]|nr:aldehyde dehydrogenase family protein [Acidimicrobiales bacterium]
MLMLAGVGAGAGRARAFHPGLARPPHWGRNRQPQEPSRRSVMAPASRGDGVNVQVSGTVRLELPELFAPALAPGDGNEVPGLQLLIDGTWRPAASGETFEVRSSIDGNVIATAAKASADDVEAAISAARRNRDHFRSLPAAARLEICAEAAEILDRHLA